MPYMKGVILENRNKGFRAGAVILGLMPLIHIRHSQVIYGHPHLTHI